MLDDPHNILIVKAARVADTAMRRRAVPKTRSDLLRQVAIIRQRIHSGNDETLAALGFSQAGIAHFYSAEYGIGQDEAALLADATLTLIT